MNRTRSDHDSSRAAVATCVTAVLFLGILSGGCGGGDRRAAITNAVGSYGDVAVLVSNPAFAETFPAVLANITPTRTFVLKTEPTYRYHFFSGDDWKRGRNYRNLLLLVRWGDGGEVQSLARRLVSKETLRSVLEQGGGIINRHDPIFRRQLAIVVVASSARRLREILEQRGATVMDTLHSDCLRRIIADNRDHGIHGEALERMWREYGFTLEFPREFRENQDRPGGFPGIEWIRTDGAMRGISIAWLRVTDPRAALADRDTLLALRRELGSVLHNEELDPSTLSWSREIVAGQPAVCLSGAWRSNRVTVGGPFQAYFLADTDRSRLICVDLLVYAPDKPKMNHFRRLRAILETFTTHALPSTRH